MKRLQSLFAVALLLAGTVPPLFAQIAAVPQRMNFQGRLAKPDGTPVPDGNYAIRFSLWTAATGGTEKWNQTINPVKVKNGMFAVLLDTGTGAADKFQGILFLEIKIGADPALTPRQSLATVAYAFVANGVKDGAITNASLANGSITADKLANNALNPLAWLLGGNGGVTSGFLGTTDNQPLVLKANNQRGLQLQYVLNGNYEGNSLLGGFWLNTLTTGVTGATLWGGLKIGTVTAPNRVTDHGGTVSGGANNRAGNDNANLLDALFATVGGGHENTASGEATTVAGGFSNLAIGHWATVGGGSGNRANGQFGLVAGGRDNTIGDIYATVGGGHLNTAGRLAATVGGGDNNIASGDYAMVPGGRENTAAGAYAFAAGRRAKANHDGALVWGDSTDADFLSTAPNQFLIRAGGGVGINTASPTQALDVNGNIRANGSLGIGTATPNFPLSFSPKPGDKISLYGDVGAHYGLGVQPYLLQIHTDAAASDIAFGYGTSAAFTETMRVTGSGQLRVGAGGVRFADGSVQTTSAGSIGWLLGGNNGTDPTMHFLGTTDNQPLAFRVNNRRAIQYQYAENAAITGFEYRSMNVLGGNELNSIAPGVVGGTIAGGGWDWFDASKTDSPNHVLADFGTVGGGYGNIASGSSATLGGGSSNQGSGILATVGGGYANTASGDDSTVAGGRNNLASSGASTVAGGGFNSANGLNSTIGGGSNNTTGGYASTVGGGQLNTAGGDYSMVVGGDSNKASGNYSFSAGRRAQANHQGAFVWADSTFADFTSTNANQFLIRASGGVGINTNALTNAGLTIGNGNDLILKAASGNTDSGDVIFQQGAATQNGRIYTDTLHMYFAVGPSNVARMSIDTNGAVLASSFGNISDARYKTHIAPFPDALNTLLSLRGVTFEWDRERWKERGFAEGRQIGFIAQEVEKVLPELVSTDSKGYKSVAYANVVPVLVEAIKTLKQGNDRIQAENTALRERVRRLETLEAQLTLLMAKVAQMEAAKVAGK